MINEQEILDEALGAEVEQVDEKFTIDSIDRLDWAIRKCNKIEADRKAKIECAERQIVKLKAYIKSVGEEADRNISFFQYLMRPFVKQLISGQKSKTFKAPSGKVSLKSQDPAITKDDAKLIEHLKASGRNDLIATETKEAPKWGDYKKELQLVTKDDGTAIYIDKNGEVVPVTVELREDKLVVEG